MGEKQVNIPQIMQSPLIREYEWLSDWAAAQMCLPPMLRRRRAQADANLCMYIIWMGARNQGSDWLIGWLGNKTGARASCLSIFSASLLFSD